VGKPIEGKIAKIVDERTVIINRGAEAGVREGMKFAILAGGDAVADPDTGEALGTWEVVKDYVKAAHVQEKISVCTAARTTADSEQKTSKTLSSAMVDVSFDKNTGNKLNVRAGDMSGRPKVGPIAVGDMVRSVES
jgi:hypothetical protein